jgi:hypothetical protein
MILTRFDPVATLAEIRRTVGASPTVPKPPTAEGSLGGLDDSADTSLNLIRDHFRERAAIAEYNGGLSRADAEVLGAICATPSDVDPEIHAKVIDAAARFLDRVRHERP